MEKSRVNSCVTILFLNDLCTLHLRHYMIREFHHLANVADAVSAILQNAGNLKYVGKLHHTFVTMR